MSSYRTDLHVILYGDVNANLVDGATIWLQSVGWTSMSPLWPAALVLAIVGIGVALLLRTGDLAAALVFLWAYAAIYAAHADNTALGAALAVGAGAVVAAALVGARRHSPWPTAHATSG